MATDFALVATGSAGIREVHNVRFSQSMEDLVRVRVAREEKERLRLAAHRRGITLSDLIRQTVIDAVDRQAA